MKADGTKQKGLTSNTADDFNPAWSPDGEKLVFSSDRDGHLNDEVWRMRAEGTDQVALTKNVADGALTSPGSRYPSTGARSHVQ